jgi:histidyl-tRNA synthetase
MGEDRLVMVLEALAPTIYRGPDAYVAPVGEGMNREALVLARELRRHDLIIELGDRSSRLRKLLEIASKIGAHFAIIVGEDEVRKNTFGLKNLISGVQVQVPRAELVQRIRSEK